MNRMRQTLSVNGNVTLDSRYFLARIITFLLCSIRIFNALGINYTEAGLLAPTIVASDLANRFFLRLVQGCYLSLHLDTRSIS